MATFNQDELLRIAHLSGLMLNEKESALFTDQINAILTYVDQLQTVSQRAVGPQRRREQDRDIDVAVAPGTARRDRAEHVRSLDLATARDAPGHGA